jgi:serine/threonine-protein kinase
MSRPSIECILHELQASIQSSSEIDFAVLSERYRDLDEGSLASLDELARAWNRLWQALHEERTDQMELGPELPAQDSSELPTLKPTLSDTSAQDGTLTERMATRPFGDYDILEEVARGGMGVVYRARHQKLGRTVALKKILAGELAGAGDVRRFRTEAQAAARLDHPNIVPVFEVGEIDGQHFFTMAFVNGVDLGKYVVAHRLSYQRIATLVNQIALAIDYAHSQGVIHRDLKPANILVDSDHMPRVMDFGLAKRLDQESDLTCSGEVMGTPGYMAPEQASGNIREVGRAADIYAIGAILYFCLTSRPPFLAGSPVETLVKILESEPPTPRSINRAVPVELERICLRCMEKDPKHRYGSALAVAEELDRYLKGQPILAEAPSLQNRFRRFAKQYPGFTAHLLAIAFVLILSQARFFASGFQDGTAHIQVSVLLLGWIAFCSAMHFVTGLRHAVTAQQWIEAIWLCMDVLFLSGLLYLLTTETHDPSLALIGFPMLIVASGLFFRVRLVCLMTIVSILAFAILQIATAHLPRFVHYQIGFAVLLAIIGGCIMYQIRRVRLLTQYFDSKRQTSISQKEG